jgi:SagB-type dehydrogenase family enzyme
MKKIGRIVRYPLFLLIVSLCFTLIAADDYYSSQSKEAIPLPKPAVKGKLSVEEAVARRRTIRSFTTSPLSLSAVSQLLFVAQGITEEKRGKRATPSAGALYPLEVYMVVGKGGVSDIKAGVYHYLPQGHRMELHKEGDLRGKLATASVNQRWVGTAPVIFVIAADYSRTTGKYKDRGIRYAHFEVGHCGENIALQAIGLGLGAGLVGAFRDNEVSLLLGLPENEAPLYIIPVGYPR